MERKFISLLEYFILKEHLYLCKYLREKKILNQAAREEASRLSIFIDVSPFQGATHTTLSLHSFRDFMLCCTLQIHRYIVQELVPCALWDEACQLLSHLA